MMIYEETDFLPLTKEYHEEMFNQLAIVNSELERIGAEERLEIEYKIYAESMFIVFKHKYPHFRINMRVHDVTFNQMDTYHEEVVDAYLKGILFTSILKKKPENEPAPVSDEFVIRHGDWKTTFHPEIQYHPTIAKINALLRNYQNSDVSYQVYICSRIRYTNKSQYTECKITCNQVGQLDWFDVTDVFSKDDTIIKLHELYNTPELMYNAIDIYRMRQANISE